MGKVFFYGNIKAYDLSVGITKKVYSQIKTLKQMGHEVYYTGYTKDGVAIFNNDGKIIKQKSFLKRSKQFNSLIRRWDLLSLSTEFIQETNFKFDYAYLRYHFFDQSYLNILKALKGMGAKTIVEAHGYPFRSLKFSKYAPIYILDILYEPVIRKYIDLAAVIGNYEKIWGCKTVQIDNAINLEEVQLLRKDLSRKNNIIRLVSVSNERAYHGYEKLVKGLSDYYNNGGNCKIEINFIGEFRASTKKLVEELDLSNKVIFHGKKYGSELEKIYNEMDLGIGALSRRAGSEYGSSIKTKEYFAKGLPFINGWKEFAFDDSYPYVKRFPIDNELIDFEEVVKFYNSIKNDEKMQSKMRLFAKDHYSWVKQFEKIFSEL